MTKHYATANAFKTALEERLKNHSRKAGIELQRLRRQVAFDRLLSRLFRYFPKDLLLKGGYAMELRIEHARATKDIDLVIKAARIETKDAQDQVIRRMLQEAVQDDSGDFFEFLVGEPTLDLEAIPYGGSRFPIDALLDNRLFVRFPIDVVISSLFMEPIDYIASEDWLGFAGIEHIPFPAISKEQQFAEKLHAYTLPREGSENSRVKDLLDLTLLVKSGELKMDILKIAIDKIFKYRSTHLVPSGIVEPPGSWVSVFTRLSKETELNMNMDQAVALIASHLNIPIIVREEKMISVAEQVSCHFCGAQSLSWLSNLRSGAINETEETRDCDCPKCHSYRVTGLFIEINNAENNSSWLSSWRNYLQSRSKEEGKSRILISTLSTSVPHR